MILNILNFLALIAAIYIIKLGSDYNKGGIHIQSFDKRLHPAEINYLHKDINYLNRGILVTLLELKRRGKIEIEKYTRESRNKTLEDYVIEYRFTLLDNTDLKDHEEVFLKNVFENKDTITTDELTKRSINDSKFLSAQGDWSNYLDSALSHQNLYEETTKGLSNRIKVLGLVVGIIGVISLVKHNPLGFLSIIATLPIFLIGINIGMEKSKEGRALLNHFTHLEEMAKKGNIKHNLKEEDLLELLALSLTMKYFLPIYENSQNFDTIDLVTNSLNEYGGSHLDDAILRGFMGFTAKTRDDTLDTNRIDYRLFK